MTEPNEAEERRLAALEEYEILDTPAEDAFDDLTALAAQICDAPIALITLVDGARQWFKSRIGISVEETSRDISFCAHALQERDLFIVHDATQDQRFAQNPLVTGDPGLRFYAGAPLKTEEGYILGTLCVLDTVPRKLSGGQYRALRILSRLVVTQLELRRSELQRRKTEDSLRASHAELQQCIEQHVQDLAAARQEALLAKSDILEVMERVSDGIVAMDKDWRYIYLNQRSAEILGRDAEELIGKHAWTEFPNAVGRPFYHACHRAAEEQRVVDHQEYFPRLQRWLEGRIYPSEKGVSVFFQDITQRKVREKELEETSERLQLAVASSGIGLWDWNLVTDEIFYAPEWKAQLGYGDDEIGNSPEEWRKRLHPEDRAGAVAYWSSFPNASDEYQRDVRLRHKSGAYRSFLTRARLYRDPDSGTPLRMLGCHIDVTARKKTERSLYESREQLRALAAHLQTVREEEAARIARELHDELGAALTGLKIDLVWLQRQVERPPEADLQQSLGARVQGTIKLVDETIENVRKLCRELRPAVLDQLGLASAIEWQAAEFQTRTGVPCEITLATDVAVDVGRATAVFRIFQEVLTNITRHAEATRVWVNLEKRGENLTLTVIDNGRGIEAAPQTGTRLGLVGMRERALAAGGNLEISSAPGEGTTVSVSVPLPDSTTASDTP